MDSPDADHYYARYFFDLTFYLVILIILLNILFGIIIDTFGELRTKKNELDHLIENNCIICELSKFNIDSKGEGWQKHIRESHFILNYFFFFVYIRHRPEGACDALELQTKRKLLKRDFSFMPFKRSLLLRQSAQ